MAESRKFNRVYEAAELALTDPWSGEVFIARSRDISKGGVRFVTDSQLKTEIDYRALISFASFPSKIKAVLKIVWIKPDGDDGRLECGSEFVEIADYDRIILTMLIDSRA
jgi:hypothetical protein